MNKAIEDFKKKFVLDEKKPRWRRRRRPSRPTTK
jgi:hypothetical protein